MEAFRREAGLVDLEPLPASPLSAPHRRSKLTVVPPPRKVAATAVMSLLDDFLARPTEGGFADWFLAKCGEDVRYIAEYRRWALWDGRRWMVDAADAVNERAKDALQAIVALIPRIEGQEKQVNALRLAHKFDSVVRIRQMLEFAATDPRVLTSIRDYDCDEWLLNVANGTLDLRDGRLLAHLKDHMLTKVIDVAYDPKATAPTWDAFLGRIFRSHPELIPFLRRAVGYTLTGSVREHKFWLLYGSGRNGRVHVRRNDPHADGRVRTILDRGNLAEAIGIARSRA